MNLKIWDKGFGGGGGGVPLFHTENLSKPCPEFRYD